jgi:hypothetical protein
MSPVEHRNVEGITVSGSCFYHDDPEAQLCPECGVAPWRLRESGRFEHEDFYVRDGFGTRSVQTIE